MCGEDNSDIPDSYCPSQNDTILCWPASRPGSTVYLPCPSYLNLSNAEAHRKCLKDGTWENFTSYRACLHPPDHETDLVNVAQILTYVYFVESIISLVFLVITLFIFCYFRSLQCSRITIHKHLVFSFIIYFVVTLIMVMPHTLDFRHSYQQAEWLCKGLKALSVYTRIANFAWMLVEGIYLHNRLAICVFTSDAPFKLFCFIGWGIPFIITCLWAGLMQLLYTVECWHHYSGHSLIFIIFIPILIALVINSAFLVNIIRVLVVKLRNNNTLESRRIRKAIKATVVLLPLLGVANLLFLAQPNKGPVMIAIRSINTVLPACQGIFVSILYCFMNSEVQNVIQKTWKRFRINRAMNQRSWRQGSRTSSYFLSQSESTAPRRFNLRKSFAIRDKEFHSVNANQQSAIVNGNGRHHPFGPSETSSDREDNSADSLGKFYREQEDAV